MWAVVVRAGGGGSKQQTGLQFWSLPVGRDKVLIPTRPLSLPVARDQNWSPVCCFDPPPFTTTTQPRQHFDHGADAVQTMALHSPKSTGTLCGRRKDSQFFLINISYRLLFLSVPNNNNNNYNYLQFAIGRGASVLCTWRAFAALALSTLGLFRQ